MGLDKTWRRGYNNNMVKYILNVDTEGIKPENLWAARTLASRYFDAYLSDEKMYSTRLEYRPTIEITVVCNDSDRMDYFDRASSLASDFKYEMGSDHVLLTSEDVVGVNI